MGFQRVQQFGDAWIGTAKTSFAVRVPVRIPERRVVCVIFTIPEVVGSVSVADTDGVNVYTETPLVQAPPRVAAAGEPRLHLFITTVDTPIEAGAEITVTCPSVSSGCVEVREYLGINPTVHKVWEDGATNAAPSSGNITTTIANTLLLGMIASKADAAEADFTAGTGWTLYRTGDTGTGTGELSIQIEERLVTATGTYDADGTFAGSEQWHAAIVAFTGKVALAGRAEALCYARKNNLPGARLTVDPGPAAPTGGFTR